MEQLAPGSTLGDSINKYFGNEAVALLDALGLSGVEIQQEAFIEIDVSPSRPNDPVTVEKSQVFVVRSGDLSDVQHQINVN